MPSHRSDRRSSPGSSDASPRPESSVMCDVVKQEGGKEDCAVVLVVDGVNFYETQQSCKSLVPKSRKVKPKILVKVTTSNWLQATINEVNGDQTRRYLTILVSQTIEEILFHVSATIGTLRILRCSDKQDTLGELLINGLSTFSSYKLDDWQGRKHKHQLYLGDRVMIKPDLFRSPSWATNKFSNPEVQEKDRIRSYFTSMDDIPMKDPTWWQSWKVVISSMLGLAASGAKILAGFEATAKGVYLQFQYGNALMGPIFGAKVGAGAAKASMVLYSVGPAVLLGAGVAATVYFFPWDSVFSLFKSAWQWALDGIKALWQRFKDWLASKFSRNVPKTPKSWGPMSFQA